jgi:hypothetical protein
VEIRVNRIGRSSGRYGTGNGLGGGGSPPPGGGDESGAIDTIGIDTVDPVNPSVAQVNCVAAHNLVNGQQVLIADNVGVTNYNGTHTISVSGATTFEIPIAFEEIGAGGTWTLV